MLRPIDGLRESTLSNIIACPRLHVSYYYYIIALTIYIIEVEKEKSNLLSLILYRIVLPLGNRKPDKCSKTCFIKKIWRFTDIFSKYV